MATFRHAWFPAACAAALMGLSAASAWAEDTEPKEDFVYSELRLGFSSVRTPTIRQKKPDEDLGSISGDKYGTKFGITYLSGSAPADSLVGKVWGAQFSIGSYAINVGGTDTNLTQPMIDLYYGWQYGILETQGLRGFGELLPFIGAGASHLELEDKARIGAALEAGLRAGAYLTERNWELGVTATYLLGFSKVYYTIGDDKRIYEITANSLGFGIEGGYRF